MTSPMGRAPGQQGISDAEFYARKERADREATSMADWWRIYDEALPPDDFEWFAAKVHGGKHRKPESMLAMRGVTLCPRCQDRHFRPYPENPGYSCHQVECECWCTQGTGN